MDHIPSKWLDAAVSELASLPGIGKKTAMRLALHLLDQDKEKVIQFSRAFVDLKMNTKRCTLCCNISDLEICSICSDKSRDPNILCIVEDIRDVIAIENTGQYRGLYHVLGGKISPMEGIGPSDLNVDQLLNRLKSHPIKELIFALSSTPEGDTTGFYLYKKMQHADLKITSIARGISFGGELEYADEITLGRSILNRIPYHANER